MFGNNQISHELREYGRNIRSCLNIWWPKYFSWDSKAALPENNLNTREIWFLVYGTQSILTWLKLAFKSLGSTLLQCTGPQWMHGCSHSYLLITCDYLPGQAVKWLPLNASKSKGLHCLSRHPPDPGFHAWTVVFPSVRWELSGLPLGGWLLHLIQDSAFMSHPDKPQINFMARDFHTYHEDRFSTLRSSPTDSNSANIAKSAKQNGHHGFPPVHSGLVFDCFANHMCSQKLRCRGSE